VIVYINFLRLSIWGLGGTAVRAGWNSAERIPEPGAGEEWSEAYGWVGEARCGLCLELEPPVVWWFKQGPRRGTQEIGTPAVGSGRGAKVDPMQAPLRSELRCPRAPMAASRPRSQRDPATCPELLR
jgi:hypothetical protein